MSHAVGMQHTIASTITGCRHWLTSVTGTCPKEMVKLSFRHKIKSLLKVSTCGIGLFGAVCFYKNDETFYKNVVMPMVHLLPPEASHNLAIFVSKHRIIPKATYTDEDVIAVKVFGKEFPNPIGIAAGFDKNGEAILGLQDMGFGFVEIGSVTPLPQPGNDKPRLFRLSEDMAVINRYGFNNQGHDRVLNRIKQAKALNHSNIVGVNLGKNKTSSDAVEDYVKGVHLFGPVADYLVINISSPNTPGLRQMQQSEPLKQLLSGVIKARNSLPNNIRPPILLKLAPDLTNDDLKSISTVLRDKQCRIDGLIICNTTIERPNTLLSSLAEETGGLSGRPLKDASTRMIRAMSNLVDGIPIIGVGGIENGEDAYEKIKAGATLVQLYSSIVYYGPPVVTKIKRELVDLLNRDGYRNVSEAVGKNNK